MMNFVKRGAFMLFVASFALTGLTSCDDEDDKYENVTPPTVEIIPSSVSGVVTSKMGDALAGATVTMGTSKATTDASGVYKFEGVAAGKQTIKAEAKGYLAAEGAVEVLDNGKTQNVVWNAALALQAEKKVEVSATENTETEVVTETIKNNEKAKVEVDAEVSAAAIESKEENVEVIIAPIYDENSVVSTSRSGDQIMLVGTNVRCSDPKATINKPIALTFKVDNTMKGAQAMKFSGSKWVPAVSEEKEDGTVVVYADEFTAYGLFFNVTFSTEKDGSVSILDKDFNNLYGGSDMKVGSVDYTYKSGMEYKGGGNMLSALLIEKLAARYGTASRTMNGSYPLDVVLPIGTMLSIAGSQQTISASATCAGASAHVTIYSNVYFTITTTNRQHSGGTN